MGQTLGKTRLHELTINACKSHIAMFGLFYEVGNKEPMIVTIILSPEYTQLRHLNLSKDTYMKGIIKLVLSTKYAI